MKVFIGGLDYQLTEDNLKSAFQAYGEVELVVIPTDRDTGRPKGFGFVEMPEKEEALKAIEGLNGTELGGKTITVNEARPKPKHNDHRGRSGGGGRSRAGGSRRGGSGGGRS